VAPNQVEVLDCIQLWDQAEVLMDDVDRAGMVAGVGVRVPSADRDLRARVGLVDAGQHLDEGRLP
jgi:hypothetical protein